MRGTTHQATSAAAGMGIAYGLHTSLEISAALIGGFLLAARGPDQLEFRWTLNALRRFLRPFKPRPVRNHPGVFTKPSLVRRGWDRLILPHGPSEAFVERLYIPHRGPTHWLAPTGVLVACAAGVLSVMVVQTRPVAQFVALGVLLGYWLHPVLDAFNHAPVELLPGWEVWAPRWLRVRSGGFVDGVLCAACIAVVVVLALKVAPADWQERVREHGR